MSNYSGKMQGEKNQPNVHEPSSEQSGNRPAFQFTDNRVGAVRQKRLHEMANNSSQANQLAAYHSMFNDSIGGKKPAQFKSEISANTSAPLQRKIQIKGGALYSNQGELPLGAIRDSADLQGKANHAEKYLVKSSADLTKRANGQQSEMLSPHRHLIGESHDASQFTTAIENWGWGADKMVESFQTSADVKDRLTVENKALNKVGFSTNPYYRAKELENLHPFVIQGLSMLRFVLSELKGHVKQAENIAAKISRNVNIDVNKATFKQAESIISNEQSSALDVWKEHLLPHFDSYVAACTERLKTARGGGDTSAALLHDMATGMAAIWNTVGPAISSLSKKSYGWLDSWAETHVKLQTRAQNLDTFIANFVDVWASHLVNMTKAEARTVAGGNGHDAEIDQGWNDAKATKSGRIAVESIGPMREIFMQNNINSNLAVPGIVQIGSKHVTNLNGKITDGKYHANYDAFVTDTKS